MLLTSQGTITRLAVIAVPVEIFVEKVAISLSQLPLE